MQFLQDDLSFNSLSLTDVLRAREAFHVHLMHKANVIGTAVGRYLIRKDDPYPPEKPSAASKLQPRTLENSEVREYSWPCVLVFVENWAPKHEFGSDGVFEATDLVPKTIYMPDGRRVPVCVVAAPLVTDAEPPFMPPLLKDDNRMLSGGYPIITTVQGVAHIASTGCLVTDGHTTYLLTSRHVTGDPGTRLQVEVAGRKVDLGIVSRKQIGITPFERLYPTWPGAETVVNVDVGLIELEDVRPWSASIFQLGQLGPLADLSVHNLSLNIIGCPVRARAGVSGPLEGQIAALFYRYKAVAGREYVADFLIGSRDETPLATHPGDSGSLWVVDSPDAAAPLMPLAIQWGGAVFGNALERQPFALATNLSNVCRDLNVEILRSSHLASFEYWGAVGHYTIGALACGQVQDKRLHDFMLANQDRISFKPGDITAKSANDVSVPEFVPLADVPDKVWKFAQSEKPFGRKGPENPNHYADIDLEFQGRTLESHSPTADKLEPEIWRTFYKSVGFNSVSQRGLLPFRVWQIFIEMQKFVASGDVVSFIAAAGVLAHYVGDACQPLHCSQFDDGDPFHNPDGTKSDHFLPHGKALGHGVHSAYEASMLDTNYDEAIKGVSHALTGKHGMKLVASGREAGFAALELMRRTRHNLNPKDIVDEFIALGKAKKTRQADVLLWEKFKKPTITCIADGCRTLAMIWESAWASAGGNAISTDQLKPVSKARLKKIYEGQGFVPSKPLGQIDPFLQSQVV